MDTITVAGIGIITVFLAASLKTIHSEFALFVSLGAAVLVVLFSLVRIGSVLDLFGQIRNYLNIDDLYGKILLKMLGITYITETAVTVCKEGGQQALGKQIEIFGKLTLLAMGLPVVMASLEIIQQFF